MAWSNFFRHPFKEQTPAANQQQAEGTGQAQGREQQQEVRQERDQQQDQLQDQQQSEVGEDEPISPREAEQLLDALEDREQEAQKRRFRAVGRAQNKDW